jgi:hypothetical protein
MVVIPTLSCTHLAPRAVYTSGDLSLSNATADILEPAPDNSNDMEGDDNEEGGRAGSRRTRRSRTPSLQTKPPSLTDVANAEGQAGVQAGRSTGASRRGAAAAAQTERTGPTLRQKTVNGQQRFALVKAGRGGQPVPISEVDVVLMSYEQVRGQASPGRCLTLCCFRQFSHQNCIEVKGFKPWLGDRTT